MTRFFNVTSLIAFYCFFLVSVLKNSIFTEYYLLNFRVIKYELDRFVLPRVVVLDLKLTIEYYQDIKNFNLYFSIVFKNVYLLKFHS